jgi:hypothetical protein
MAIINDYPSLLSEIVALQLFYRRLNDVQLGDEIYRIVFKDVKDTTGKLEPKLFLRNSKKDDYGLTLRQLAGLRIADGKITAEWFDGFKEDTNGSVFQDKCRELVDGGATLETLKFKVVAQLKVKNEFAKGKVNEVIPVYQDRCYTGSTEYSATLRGLTKGKTGNFWETPEYSSGVREAREKLHATPLKDGKEVEANIVKLPIFEIL